MIEMKKSLKVRICGDHPHYFLIVLLVASFLFTLGCSETPRKDPRVYSYSGRQLPPEPVYNRLRWVYLPDPPPVKDLAVRSPRLVPVIHLQVKNASLDAVAKALGDSAHYRSYCSSFIADRKVTIDEIGTIDELGNIIARRAKVTVMVDHGNRELRFVSSEGDEKTAKQPTGEAPAVDSAEPTKDVIKDKAANVDSSLGFDPLSGS